jgi:hypothetical protein
MLVAGVAHGTAIDVPWDVYRAVAVKAYRDPELLAADHRL